MLQRIGVFGGTFDPPHIGHLILAGEAVHHKLDAPITPLDHRLSMLREMIAHNPIFELSTLEIDRPGPHYTVDTIRLLAGQAPDAEIVLLIGGDSLVDLPTWRFAADLV
ncbi:MAG: hypothetical protein L6Q45_17225, partial [Anaerolineales bacterium]|nr:hypothetical protein [Anaerolineales bacterium]